MTTNPRGTAPSSALHQVIAAALGIAASATTSSSADAQGLGKYESGVMKSFLASDDAPTSASSPLQPSLPADGSALLSGRYVCVCVKLCVCVCVCVCVWSTRSKTSSLMSNTGKTHTHTQTHTHTHARTHTHTHTHSLSLSLSLSLSHTHTHTHSLEHTEQDVMAKEQR
jgi:hypothetical protein